jgi:thiol-disulfide isomerase/thioredoxin
MLPLIRLVSSKADWLVIPASLFMLFGCGSPVSTSDAPASVTHHSVMESQVPGSPFHKVFSNEADLVVLTFFDLYCVACQQSADNFNRIPAALELALPNERIQVTGVAIGDTEFELNVFLRKYELTYGCLPDPDKSFEEPFAVRGTPTVLVFKRINSECLEIYRHEGRLRMSDIDKLVETMRGTDQNN